MKNLFQWIRRFQDMLRNTYNSAKRAPNAHSGFNPHRLSHKLWAGIHRSATFQVNYWSRTFWMNNSYVDDWFAKYDITDPKQHTENVRTVAATEKISVKGKEIIIKDSSKYRIFRQIDKMLCVSNMSFGIVTPNLALENLPKNTSAGTPLMSKKHSVMKMTTRTLELLVLNDQTLELLELLVFIAFRVQTRTSGFKFRQVYVLPYLVQGLESCFGKNFFDHISTLGVQSVYVYNDKFPTMSERLKVLRKFAYVLSIDYKSLDLSISHDFLELFFEWFEGHINFKHTTSYTSSLWKCAYRSLIRYHLEACIITTVNGKPVIIRKQSILMSGSYFTNFIDTWVVLFAVLFHCHLRGIKVNLEQLAIKGDDILFGHNGEISLSSFAKCCFKHLGLTISIEKTIEYIKGWHTLFFLGHQMNEFGRFLDWNHTRVQMCTNEIRIDYKKDNVTPFLYKYSKMYSLCSKCTDGVQFFNQFAPAMFARYGFDFNIPEHHPKWILNLHSLEGNIGQWMYIGNDSWDSCWKNQ